MAAKKTTTKKKAASKKANLKAIKGASEMLKAVDTSKLGKKAKIKVKSKPKKKQK